MQLLILTATLLALTVIGFYLGRTRARAAASGNARVLHSLPSYYGYYVAVWCAIPALLILIAWLIGEQQIVHSLLVSSLPDSARSLPPERMGLLLNDVKNLASGNVLSRAADPELQQAADYYGRLVQISRMAMTVVVLAAAIAGLVYARQKVAPKLRARNAVEAVIRVLLIACSIVAILTTIGIILSLIFEASRFFLRVSPLDFLFGLEWSPQMAMRADQVGAAGSFGAVPLFVGTLLIAFVAMCIAMPVGLMSAIYMAEYAHPKFRAVVKPVLEILAGIPTVVYGFFAALTVAPFFRNLGADLGLNISSESALAAGVVMGIMIIPFVSSLSDDVITAVPQAMREGSYGLGATQVGDDPTGGLAGGPSRHRRRLPAGGIAGDRRDDDRRHGRRARRQPDRQPLRGGDDGHRADRHAAGRRPGVRQPEDPCGVRPRSGAVLRHAGAQHHRSSRRHQVSRAI